MTSLATLAGLLVLLIVGGIGFPVPEDVTLVGAGLLARGGSITLWQAIVTGTIGVCVADWIIYLAGRRYGDDVMRHRWIARLVRREHLATIEALVQRRGAWAVFLARFVLGTRIATFLSAGAFGMPPAVFALAETTGSVVFAAGMVTLGYLFAHQAERIAEEVGRTEHWLLLGGLIALALALVLRAVAGRWFADSRRQP